MSNNLKRASGTANATGNSLFVVPQDTTVTIIGFRLSNKSMSQKSFYITVNGLFITGLNTPLPSGSSIEINPTKFVIESGDEVLVYANEDDSVDVWMSYLEQTGTGDV